MARVGQVPDAVRILNSVLQDPQVSTQQAARCLSSLSQIAAAAGDGPAALNYAQLSLTRLRQSGPHPPKALEGDILAAIGNSDYLNGHNDLAGQHYAQSLAVFTKAGLDRGLDALALRNNWALVSDGAGTPRVALELIDQVLQLAALNEPDAPAEPTFLYNRASELEYIGRYKEAHDTYLRCVEVSRQAGARELTTVCFVGLASVSLELGDLGATGGYLADASTNVTAETAPSVRAVTKLQIIRGSFALRQGRVAAARADLDTAIDSGKNVYWKMRALLLRSEVNLADNKLDAAQADAKQALSLAQDAQGTTPFSNRTGLAWLMLGRVQAEQGKDAEAAAAFQAAVNNLSNTVDANNPKLLLARKLTHQL
jgi:tetratricopeptide (TPR) repeat protein